jgi:hypothetical protein
MKKMCLIAMTLLFCFVQMKSFGQNKQRTKSEPKSELKEINIPMLPKYWKYDSTTVEFINHRGVNAAHSINTKNKSGYEIFLKDYIFTNGTIEFDVELTGSGFPGINFRMSDDLKTGENFYIRAFGKVTPIVRQTLQYAAIIDGGSMWDLSDEYQAGATIYQEGWNHVKLVVSGKQMLVYVNDLSKPSLQIPELESGSNSGTISLSGNVIYANFKIIPNATEGLSPMASMDITQNDTRYIRKWQVTDQKDFPFGKDIIIPLPGFGNSVKSDLPDGNTIWKPIDAENRAIVNLSRIYKKDATTIRRLAWLKTTVYSEKAQEKTLYLGFSDEVWVFINGEFLHADKNYFGTPGQKNPRGRCTIENSSIKIPLKEGKNEIMIALSNYFYGWGIIAKWSDVDDLGL